MSSKLLHAYFLSILSQYRALASLATLERIFVGISMHPHRTYGYIPHSLLLESGVVCALRPRKRWRYLRSRTPLCRTYEMPPEGMFRAVENCRRSTASSFPCVEHVSDSNYCIILVIVYACLTAPKFFCFVLVSMDLYRTLLGVHIFHLMTRY